MSGRFARADGENGGNYYCIHIDDNAKRTSVRPGGTRVERRTDAEAFSKLFQEQARASATGQTGEKPEKPPHPSDRCNFVRLLVRTVLGVCRDTTIYRTKTARKLFTINVPAAHTHGFPESPA